MRSLAALALLVLFGCSDSPTDPPPVFTGAWDLTAETESCTVWLRAYVTEGDLHGYKGHGTLEFHKRPIGSTYPPILFEGDRDQFRIVTVHREAGAPFRVDPFALVVDEADEDRVAGTWTCEGEAGAWTMDRVVH